MGDLDGENYEEIVYEGYGPEGVAVLCDILTDNRNRTAGEVRKIFEVHGGNMGNTGCVGWMFERKGIFVVPGQGRSEDDLFELALEAGAEDVQAVGESFQITCGVDAFEDVRTALGAADIAPEVAEFARVASNEVELDAAAGRKVLKLIDALEDNEDVQSVTANFNIPDELMAELVAE